MKRLYRLIVKKSHMPAWSIAKESFCKEQINRLSKRYSKQGWQTHIERI